MLALLRSVFPGFDADSELTTAGGQPLMCAQYTAGSTAADNLKEAAAFCSSLGEQGLGDIAGAGAGAGFGGEMG